MLQKWSLCFCLSNQPFSANMRTLKTQYFAAQDEEIFLHYLQKLNNIAIPHHHLHHQHHHLHHCLSSWGTCKRWTAYRRRTTAPSSSRSPSTSYPRWLERWTHLNKSLQDSVARVIFPSHILPNFKHSETSHCPWTLNLRWYKTHSVDSLISTCCQSLFALILSDSVIGFVWWVFWVHWFSISGRSGWFCICREALRGRALSWRCSTRQREKNSFRQSKPHKQILDNRSLTNWQSWFLDS